MTGSPPSRPGPRRGWTSSHLEVIATTDGTRWSIADAANLLGPPQLTETQVRHLVRLASLEPVGKRFNGSRRRHVRVYDAQDLIKAYEKVATLLEDDGNV
jgi:hypothetical protein